MPRGHKSKAPRLNPDELEEIESSIAQLQNPRQRARREATLSSSTELGNVLDSLRTSTVNLKYFSALPDHNTQNRSLIPAEITNTTLRMRNERADPLLGTYT
jgi:hypothetical protein